jgi:hypothetical protein
LMTTYEITTFIIYYDRLLDPADPGVVRQHDWL